MKSEEDRLLYRSRHQTGTRPTLPDSMDEVSGWASVDICRENLGLNSDRNVPCYCALRAGFKISHHKSASVVNFVCMYVSLQI